MDMDHSVVIVGVGEGGIRGINGNGEKYNKRENNLWEKKKALTF